MAPTLYSPPPDAPARTASIRVQARRVFLLARFLTAAMVVACYVVHAMIGVWLRLTPAEDTDAAFDALALDLRIWALIFLGWTGLIVLARRQLRLHT